MSAIVVDASVAVKWFFPEIHSDAARRVLQAGRELLAPDLIWAEVGNVLWKKLDRREIAGEVALDLLRDFRRFPLQTFTAKELISLAWRFAEQFRLSIYDCLYLALAVSQNCAFVTADFKFYKSLRTELLASHLVWIQHFR